MPLITVKVFENELDEAQSRALIEKITDSVTSVTSEKLRDATWVMIEEIKDKHWAIGGNALALDDVKKMISG
ncbi:4-oxalocrotonate tautomerase family protein [Alteromonadaceae bacterium M269]|nr:4-oxalocrotonate tautomerase family protein [Alteromonadaceae bacterium M269]